MSLIEKLDGFNLDELLQMPKLIVSKSPKLGLKEEFNHYRADLILESEAQGTKFRMFIRKNKNTRKILVLDLTILESKETSNLFALMELTNEWKTM